MLASEVRPLTQRQQEIYSFIRRRILSNQRVTVRLIGAHFGIRSPNGVMCHLRALRKKGVIQHTPLVSAGISLPNVNPLALLLRIADDPEYTKLSHSLRSEIEAAVRP